MKFFTALFMTLLFALISVPASAFSQDDANAPERYVDVRLIADKTQVSSGETVTIGIQNTIYPQWHIYWVNPGDSGTALEAKWNAPEGFKFGDIKHPIPKIIPYGPLTNYGHEGTTTLIQELTLPEDLPSGPITLNASVDLLVCHDICIPESSEVSLTLNGEQQAEAALINGATNKLPRVQTLESSLSEKDGNLVINVLTEDTSIFKNLESVDILPIEWGMIDNTQKTKATLIDTGLQLEHKRGERVLTEVSDYPFVIAYTDTDGNRQGISLSAPTSIMADAPAAIGFFQALILAVLGGLILNLMPCVFPVLSMKALSLISLNDKEEKKARAYGLSYTAGILVSFGLIAGTLIALKAGGAEIGWGFQLQSPLVIIALTYLVFIIGLNLAGFFEFSGRFGHWGQKLTTKSGHGGAFWTGVLATLVATPCTAPFMGAAIGFALTQNAFFSMLVFLGLGFGLALPYLLLCYIPALRQKLPRPGAWMETFRNFLSFPMFITAAWLLWVLTQQATQNTIFFALLGLISIAFILWILKTKAPNFILGFLRRGFLALAIFGALFPLLTPPMEKSEFQDYTPATLEKALKSKDPVFVNMTAAWCITCKVNERIALTTDRTVALFEEKNIQYIKGDWTNKNATIAAYLESFGRQGVPLYVYYPAPNNNGKRPDPVLLPQILTNSIIFETISGE